MNRWLKWMAGGTAVLFILSNTLVLFLFNLGQVLTDRQAVQEAIQGDLLVRQVGTTLLTEILQQQAAQRGLLLADEDIAALQMTLAEAIPADWAEEQTRIIVDAMFNYFETGDESALIIPLDTTPLLELIETNSRQETVESILDFLPICPAEGPPPTIAGVPTCLPAEVDISGFAGQIETVVDEFLSANQQLPGLSGTIEFDLLTLNDENNQLLTVLEQLRLFYRLGRSGVWWLWLLPLSLLLLIVVFGVRSLPGLGHWWGWPFLLGGVTALILTFFMPLLIDYILPFIFFFIGLDLTALGALAPTIEQFGQASIANLFPVWLNQIRWQAGLWIVVGLFLGGSALIFDWMFTPQEEASQRY